MDSNKIGYIGEQRVVDLLAGSRWLGLEELNQGSHHDIDWEGIKIEVKTSVSPFTSKDGKPMFNFTVSGHNDCDVYVFLGRTEEKDYFWVEPKEAVKSGYYGKLDNTVTSDNLEKEIKKVIV